MNGLLIDATGLRNGLMPLREKEIGRKTELYYKYLNGPLGKGVMAHIKEGESFIIKSQDELVSISKQDGKAIVKVVRDKNQSETIRRP